MLSIEQFKKKWNISKGKAQIMCPYIEGAQQCPNCHRWEIPDDAIAIYIPHKSKYKQKIKLYCYVLDAIMFGMKIVPELSGFSLDECERVVRNLKNADTKYIVPKNESLAESLNYFDYDISPDYALTWAEKNSNQNKNLIFQTLITIQKTAEAVVCVTTYLASTSGV